MKREHTPGPWVYFSGNRSIWNAERAVCRIYGPTVHIEPEDEERIAANARLIAAAPELLDALIEAVATAPIIWMNSNPRPTRMPDPSWIVNARAAIAKATS